MTKKPKIPSKFEVIASIVLVVVVMMTYMATSPLNYKLWVEMVTGMVEVVTGIGILITICVTLLLNIYLLAFTCEGYKRIKKYQLRGWTFAYTGFLLLQLVIINMVINYIEAEGVVAGLNEVLRFNPGATIIYLIPIAAFNLATYNWVLTEYSPVEILVNTLTKQGWLQKNPQNENH